MADDAARRCAAAADDDACAAAAYAAMTPPTYRSVSFAAAASRPSRAPSAHKVPAAFACLHAVPIV